MQILKNSRQMPKTKAIVCQKDYMDVLYGYLQTVSEMGNEGRTVPNKIINYKKLGEILGISRQTISKKINKLLELGLLIAPEEKGGDYFLPNIKSNEAFLIPNETLRKMVNCFQDRVIDIYIYLANKYIYNKEKPYRFTLIELKDFCGLSIKTESNNYLITDILEILEALKLISYNLTGQKCADGAVKSFYTITCVRNNLGC